LGPVRFFFAPWGRGAGPGILLRARLFFWGRRAGWRCSGKKKKKNKNAPSFFGLKRWEGGPYRPKKKRGGGGPAGARALYFFPFYLVLDDFGTRPERTRPGGPEIHLFGGKGRFWPNGAGFSWETGGGKGPGRPTPWLLALTTRFVSGLPLGSPGIGFSSRAETSAPPGNKGKKNPPEKKPHAGPKGGPWVFFFQKLYEKSGPLGWA